MAAALMRQMFGREVFVESCGMSSHGQDSACDPLEDEAFDLVVSLTPEAFHRAQDLSRGRAMEVEYWPMPDPTQGEVRSREAALAAYRQLREALRERLVARFGAPSTPDV
jgi:protein-tyrosine-phosphatase